MRFLICFTAQKDNFESRRKRMCEKDVIFVCDADMCLPIIRRQEVISEDVQGGND